MKLYTKFQLWFHIPWFQIARMWGDQSAGTLSQVPPQGACQCVWMYHDDYHLLKIDSDHSGKVFWATKWLPKAHKASQGPFCDLGIKTFSAKLAQWHRTAIILFQYWQHLALFGIFPSLLIYISNMIKNNCRFMWPLTALKAHIKAAGIYITLGNKFAPQSMLTSICVKFFFIGQICVKWPLH